jgi:hypothetical protein
VSSKLQSIRVMLAACMLASCILHACVMLCTLETRSLASGDMPLGNLRSTLIILL